MSLHHPTNPPDSEIELRNRWSEQRANDWYKHNNWIVGCNYIPSNAINQLEMWQPETFDPITIRKELKLAEDLGFNTVRVFLHHLLWEQDPKGFLERIDTFLGIADQFGIKSMLVLFDAVWDPHPKLGKQPEPKPGVHNSGWVQSPGYHILNNADNYDMLRGYVQGVIDRFKTDQRVLIWDMFNEPDNMNTSSYKDDDYAIHKAELSLILLKKSIAWARELDPIQPLTSAPWKDEWTDEKLTVLDNYMFTHSDIITFHCYENREGMEARIKQLQRFNRPMLCTEYMARPHQCTFEEILPILKRYNVGAYNWGFVAGKTQTNYPWDSWSKQYHTEPELWFHDIFKSNGEPYNLKEIEVIKSLCKDDRKVA